MEEISIAQILRELFEEIKHGDQEHQDWLRDKIELFIQTRDLK
jgi:bacterioferritin (cytochrome b1)